MIEQMRSFDFDTGDINQFTENTLCLNEETGEPNAESVHELACSQAEEPNAGSSSTIAMSQDNETNSIDSCPLSPFKVAESDANNSSTNHTSGDGSTPSPPTGRTKRRKLAPREMIKEDEEAVKKLPKPIQPYGIGHYIVSKSGEIFDPRFNSQEDFRRRSCKRVIGLQSLSISQPSSTPKLSTQLIPFCSDSSNFFLKGTQYWLTSAVLACRDYQKTEKMLESGKIQAAIHALKDTEDILVKMWLLSLLRLAASCKSSGHNLLYAASDIYQFLLDVLQQNNEHFYFPIKKMSISDSRGYDYFIILALAAHTRPILMNTKPLPFRRECMYKNHVHLMIGAYGEDSRSQPETFAEKLPKHLRGYYNTLTMHDIAIEIFVDIAKYGLFSYFSNTAMNSKWTRCLNHITANRPLDIVTLQLCQVLHQAPQAIISRMQFPVEIYDECLSLLSSSLNDILENTNVPCQSQKKIVPLQYTVACCKALISMLKCPEQNGSSSDLLRSIQTRAYQDILVRYVLTIPFHECKTQNDDYAELYESVWSLLYAMSYTFPMMMNTMIKYACDEDVPLCLGGHAAMFSGTVIVFTKYRVSRGQLHRIYDTLRRYAIHAKSESSRLLRLELAFRIGLFLQDEESGESVTESKFGEELPARPKTLTTAYRFDDQRALRDGERCQVVDAIDLFEFDRITPLFVNDEDTVIDDGLNPTISYPKYSDCQFELQQDSAEFDNNCQSNYYSGHELEYSAIPQADHHLNSIVGANFWADPA